MKILSTATFILVFPAFTFAQSLPKGYWGNITCRDLLDVAAGRASRPSMDGSSYVPIPRPPQTNDVYEKALQAHTITLCKKVANNEMSHDEFRIAYQEKAYQLQQDQAKEAAAKRKEALDRAVAENNARNQQQALQNQQRAIAAQREATQEAARQAELNRRQQDAQHQEQLQQQQRQQQQPVQRSMYCRQWGAGIMCD